MNTDLVIEPIYTESGEKRRRGVCISTGSEVLKLDTFEYDLYTDIVNKFEKIDSEGEFWVRGLRSGALLFQQGERDRITVKKLNSKEEIESKEVLLDISGKIEIGRNELISAVELAIEQAVDDDRELSQRVSCAETKISEMIEESSTFDID